MSDHQPVSLNNQSLDGAKAAPGEVKATLDALYEAHQRLQELSGGQADALLHPGGQSYLLQAAQKKLHESEERFRALFATAATGIAVAAPDGKYLQANAAYCQMIGYTEDELRSLDYAALTYPDDLSLNRKLRDDLLSGKHESFFLQKRYVKKDGAIVWVRERFSDTQS